MALAPEPEPKSESHPRRPRGDTRSSPSSPPARWGTASCGASSTGLLRLWFRPRVVGTRDVPATGPVILAPVHRSFADFGFTAFCTDRKLFFMAKDSLWKNNGSGRLLLYVGAFPVHRESADREALQRAEEVLTAARCWSCSPRELVGGAGDRRPHGGGGVPLGPYGCPHRANRHRRDGPVDAQGDRHPQALAISVVVGPAIGAPARTGGGRVSRSAVHAATEDLVASSRRSTTRPRQRPDATEHVRHCWMRGLSGLCAHGARWSGPPRVSRLRLGRHGGHRPGHPQNSQGERQDRHLTHATTPADFSGVVGIGHHGGRPMASPTWSTPIPTPTRAVASHWYTTGSSKTRRRSRTRFSPRDTSSVPTPTARCWPT